ncbi:MAG: DEAD/DEAH box helicase [Candidatus Marinimicrobia bacterium]|nr:DEAD/DEAH box helicase [Candidatus Neomarinimicrobiota bacterium]
MTDILKFSDLGLSNNSLSAIRTKGFEEPTAIQAMTIPVMLKNDKNVIAQAQTGTGKTAAFGLPILDLIDPDKTGVQALILTPTRELANQVSEEIHSLRGEKQIRTIPIYGGQSIDQQLRRLKKGVHIVVGTPGRIIDHLKRKTLNLRNIEHLVLDEADEMLNMGFIEDMEEIMKHTNPQKRTLLFSATMPDRIRDLAKTYMGGYELLKAKKENVTTDLTEQIYFEVKASDKFDALCRIVDFEDNFYGLVFCRTKQDADMLVTRLLSRGYDAEAIHGDISQAQRERTLNRFKKKSINILVATDVAARGIDVSDLSHVINFALPHDPESYVHRIGRTGRAGKEGTAITFITPSEYKKLMYIQRVAKTSIKRSNVPSVKDIVANKKQKISDDLNGILDEEIDSDYYNWAKNLLEANKPSKILAAVLNYAFNDELNPETYGKVKEFASKGYDLDKQGKARLFVALGKKDKMRPDKLALLIMHTVKIQSRDISDIRVMDNFSFVTVPFEYAEPIIKAFKVKKKGQKPLVMHAKK